MVRKRRRSILRSLTSIAATAGLVSVGAFGSSVAPASAADLDKGSAQFSGTVRNYGAYVSGSAVFGVLDARANISESVVTANSAGLSKYAGTGPDSFALPREVAENPDSRVYARATPIAAGAVGFPIEIVNAQAYSTTKIPTARQNQNGINLDLGPIGQFKGFDGSAESNWTDNVLSKGGTLGRAEQNTGSLEFLRYIPLAQIILDQIPGVQDAFPGLRANLGQSSSEVKLVSAATATCPDALAVESTASWNFADARIFNGLASLSWGGDAIGEAGEITVRANGRPGGAVVEQSKMPTMQIEAFGKVIAKLDPGLSVELDRIFEGGSPLAMAIRALVNGQLTYGGTTNEVAEGDGTRATASMNGLNVEFQLLNVKAPFTGWDIGSAAWGSFGVERADLEVTMGAGGLNGGPNCDEEQDASADPDADADPDASADADAGVNANAAASAAASAKADDDSNA
ncbi:hypothetical protein, partial [Microlunatus sp. GCM10028923]|uniref:hypothetical protein n=1 Tax=Microlunatus sp. GCM10028923 TaxID=3273400 RepID=UPI003606FAC7